MGNNTIIRVLLIGSLLLMLVGCAKAPENNIDEPVSNRMMPQDQSVQPVEPAQPDTATAPAMEYGAPTESTK